MTGQLNLVEVPQMVLVRPRQNGNVAEIAIRHPGITSAVLHRLAKDLDDPGRYGRQCSHPQAESDQGLSWLLPVRVTAESSLRQLVGPITNSLHKQGLPGLLPRVETLLVVPAQFALLEIRVGLVLARPAGDAACHTWSFVSHSQTRKFQVVPKSFQEELLALGVSYRVYSGVLEIKTPVNLSVDQLSDLLGIIASLADNTVGQRRTYAHFVVASSSSPRR